jgi:hypothetical protein
VEVRDARGDDVLVAVAHEVLGAGVEGGIERALLVDLHGIDVELTLAVEHPATEPVAPMLPWLRLKA